MEEDSKGSVSHPGQRDSELLGWGTDRGVEAFSPRIWDPGAQAVHTAVIALI